MNWSEKTIDAVARAIREGEMEFSCRSMAERAIAAIAESDEWNYRYRGVKICTRCGQK